MINFQSRNIVQRGKIDITFGTDGWRAVLDKDFTGENVERVTLALSTFTPVKSLSNTALQPSVQNVISIFPR